MIEIQINRLPGGDETRRTTVARITLTNTGEGLGGVKIYDVKLAEADERVHGEVTVREGRTHRELDEGLLTLVQRAVERLIVPLLNGGE